MINISNDRLFVARENMVQNKENNKLVRFAK